MSDRSSPASKGGSAWATSRGKTEVVGYVDNELHDQMLKLSKSSGIPISHMIERSFKAMLDAEKRKKILGVTEPKGGDDAPPQKSKKPH